MNIDIDKPTEPVDDPLHDAGYPGWPMLGSVKPDNTKGARGLTAL